MGYLLLILYSLLAPVIAGLYALFFLLSPRRSLMKALGGELRERLGLAPVTAGAGPVWIHAASMGEVKAVSKFAPDLAAALGAPLLLTSSTASGRAEAAKLGAALLSPLDFYPLAANFVAKARPRALVVVETEIWPATLFAAARAGVPVYMVNARVSAGTFRLYRAISPLSRLAFSGVAKVLAQSVADAERFRRLPGLEGKVSVTGNLKHDLIGASGASTLKAEEFIKAAGWDGSPVFTAGSTHPEEEPLIINAWREAAVKVPGLKLVLVPRHPEKLALTEAALKDAGAAYAKWSAGPVPGADCLVVDAMGLLQAFYAVSGVCFVGGTLDRTGGHNLLEPALFAKPALFGPNYGNARQAGDALIKEKGGFLVGTASQLAGELARLFNDPSELSAASAGAVRTLSGLRGATPRTITGITSSLRRP
jgi:3-deoxy-D-manno-octulosonic-acid transferase